MYHYFFSIVAMFFLVNISFSDQNPGGSKILKETIRQDWQDSGWFNTQCFTYLYNSKGVKTEENIKTWENGKWLTGHKLFYNYDKNGNLTEIQYYLKHFKPDTFLLSNVRSFTYNNKGNVLSKETFQPGAYLTKSTETYTRNKRCQLIELQTKNYFANEWHNGKKEVYSYNKHGEKISAAIYSWSGLFNTLCKTEEFAYNVSDKQCQREEIHSYCSCESKKCDPLIKTVYNYDSSGDTISIVNSSLKDNHWVVTSNIVFTFQPNRKHYERLTHSGGNNGLLEQEKSICAFNQKGTIKVDTTYSFKDGCWRKSYLMQYFYE